MNDEEWDELLCYIIDTITTCKELTELIIMRANEKGYGYEFYMGGG